MVMPIASYPSGVAQASIRQEPRAIAVALNTQSKRPPVIQSNSPSPRSPESTRANTTGPTSARQPASV